MFSQAKDLLDTEQGPYVVIALQECSRMNVLILEMKRSLLELVKGMDGQLNKTQAMEDLQQALARNEVNEYVCEYCPELIAVREDLLLVVSSEIIVRFIMSA